MDPVTSSRLAHGFKGCGTVPIREGTAALGSPSSPRLSPVREQSPGYVGICVVMLLASG